jgi:hypothetical protein
VQHGGEMYQSSLRFATVTRWSYPSVRTCSRRRATAAIAAARRPAVALPLGVAVGNPPDSAVRRTLGNPANRRLELPSGAAFARRPTDLPGDGAGAIAETDGSAQIFNTLYVASLVPKP